MPETKIKVLDDQAMLMLSLPLHLDSDNPQDTTSVCQLSPSMLLMSSINMEKARAKSLPGPRTQDNETEAQNGYVTNNNNNKQQSTW